MTDEAELPYKIWLSLARQSAAIEEAFRAKKPPGVSIFDFRLDDLKDADYYRQYAALFAPYADACVYLFRLTQDESGWKGARSWFAHCALWPGEANAYRALLQRPSRIRGGLLDAPKAIEVLPARLSEVAADKQLLGRC